MLIPRISGLKMRLGFRILRLQSLDTMGYFLYLLLRPVLKLHSETIVSDFGLRLWSQD